jgi:DNA-binding NtrC family response regulator
VPVLVSGESGTGKELVANAIHRLSHRAEGPFVAVNCAALPPALIQAELFGHEKGAFTGAVTRKIGRIERASGGTLFLDEITELTPDLQVNLLRFLQEGYVERVGGTIAIDVDVRIIAATNADIDNLVTSNRFREDLYYRLNVVGLELPPLRERDNDVETLARHYLTEFRQDDTTRARDFTPRALAAIRRYGWPGNVREMMNAIRRAVVLAEGPNITVGDLELAGDRSGFQTMTLAEARDLAEKNTVRDALSRNGENVSATARLLGVSRVTLYRLMSKHNLKSGMTQRPGATQNALRV